MRYERMTVDDYAAHQRSLGLKVVKFRTTWWAEVRPFFFRPLIPLTEIDPDTGSYPRKSVFGGCLHAVPRGRRANAHMHFFIYDDVQNYNLSRLNEKHRYITRKGIRNFTARQLTDQEQFAEEAYPLYLSFYNRTGYEYKKERLDKACFRQWSAKIFTTPRLLILGAFHEEKLSAIDISCQVEDLIIDDIFFSDTESLGLKVTDFLLHTIRETAAASDAVCLFRGLPTGQRTLDESKIMRGCKVLQKPALLRLNPLALFAARLFMKSSYVKLKGITALSTEEKHLVPAGH